MARQLEEYQLIERSIIKKFRKSIWNPFIEGVKNYSLINKGDKVGLKLENSAESLLCAKLMQQLNRISDVEFEMLFVANEDAIDLAQEMNIPLAENLDACNKTVEFYCFDDVIEKTLLSMMYHHNVKTIIPEKDNAIRPMYCIERDSIYAFSRYNDLGYSYKAPDDSEMAQVQAIVQELKDKGEGVENSIFKSTQAVCLDTLLGYEKDSEYHWFLDRY